MSLPLHLRAYQEPTKEDASRTFYNLPLAEALYPFAVDAPVSLVKQYGKVQSVEKDETGWMPMEISAVLSVEGKEEVYVSGMA